MVNCSMAIRDEYLIVRNDGRDDHGKCKLRVIANRYTGEKSALSTAAQWVMNCCEQLALFTEEPGQVTRRYLTEPMRGVHDSIKAWMQDAKMTVRIDAAGNLIGRFGAATQPALLIGSHLDTVPNAGKYDGILGVLLGVAAVASLGKRPLPFAVEVIGFSEEEGVRYSQPYLGSHALAGSFDPRWLDRKDDAGITMRDAIAAFGLAVDGLAGCVYDPGKVIGFVEAHLEQGPILEREQCELGVVRAIIGQSRLTLRFRGEAGHAGTMPMELRRDALAAAAKWIAEVQRQAQQTAGLRATVGRVQVLPNASNVIPAVVELSLDVRHELDAVRQQAVSDLVSLGHTIAQTERLQFEIIHQSESKTVGCNPELQAMLQESCAACGYAYRELVSGAGHDAVIMGSRFPMAMLFLRHPEGISHHPRERVNVDDVAAAIRVLTVFIDRLATRK